MNKTLTILFAVTCSLNGIAALAQPVTGQSATSASPLSPIYACAEKTDAMQRLACFDAAVAAVKAAEARSEIVAMDQPRVAAVRREAFGFRIPSLPRFGLGGSSAAQGTNPDETLRQSRDDQTEEQTFAVVRVAPWGERVAFYLENGNVWHTVEVGELNMSRKTPFNVRIRAAALGSYILSIEGRNRGYRVRRIE